MPTAGLILTALPLEQAVQAWVPDRCQGLSAAFSIPVTRDMLACWKALVYRVEAPQQGRSLTAIGQVLRSDGLSVQRLEQRSVALVIRVERQRWLLFSSCQALWTLQDQQYPAPQ